MSDSPRYRVHFRRRREGRTDYRVRLKLLKSGRPRAVVRLSGRRVRVAVVGYDPAGDRVLASADSAELGRVDFPVASLASTPAAYLTAYLAGLRAKASGQDEAILDLGISHPTAGGRFSAALKGLLDSGLDIPHGDEGFPTVDRLSGSHLPKPLPQPLETYKQKLAGLTARAGSSP